MSQKERILEMFRSSPNRTVSCSEFAKEYLFHKLASRCSDLKKQGYEILYIPSDTDSPMDAKYRLIKEPSNYKEDNDGQYMFI